LEKQSYKKMEEIQLFSSKKTKLNLITKPSKNAKYDRIEPECSYATNTLNSQGDTITWKALNLSDWILQNCLQMSMCKPTEIQQRCIPRILQGLDVIGGAPTGSGKTAAFAVPILQKLCEDPYGIFALILTPTRELAFQIEEQFIALGASMNSLRIQVVIGGQDIIEQSVGLSKRPHIVIATPGRLVAHLDSNSSLSFQKIRFLVLDEADRLLNNEGLSKSVLSIVRHLCSFNVRRQTLLFSATMNISQRHIDMLRINDAFQFFVNNHSE